jgi:hypothetical protein
MKLKKLSLIALTAALAACGSDSDTQAIDTKNGQADLSNYTDINATTGAAYLDLASGHTVTKSENWQFAYEKYVGFSVNGGASGDGTVSACIAYTPEGIYDAQGKPVQSAFEALTRKNTQDDFNAVNIASCNSDDYTFDSISAFIKNSDWLAADYSQGAPIYSASTEATNGWIVSSASNDQNGNTHYGRVKVNEVFYESGVKRAITFSLENWDANGTVFEAVNISPEVNFTTDRQYWDMESNSVVTENDDWELSIKVDGHAWVMQINASVSGNGKASVAHILVDSANLVTDPTDIGNTGEIYKYSTDSSASSMNGPGNYGALHYGVDESHNMWPNFTTYLYKDDTGENTRYFKAQIVSNNGEDGTLASGNLYVRYAEVSE